MGNGLAATTYYQVERLPKKIIYALINKSKFKKFEKILKRELDFLLVVVTSKYN